MKNVISSPPTTPSSTHHALAHANHLIKKALNIRNPNNFFKFLCVVVDYIESEPHFANLCWKWQQDAQEVKSRIHSLELQVYTKSKIAYETLKAHIRNSKIGEIAIDAKIQELDGLFASEEQCCPPFPWRLAYDGVKELGTLLEKTKRFDLLDGFVTLQNRDVSFISSDGQTYEMRKELFVEFA